MSSTGGPENGPEHEQEGNEVVEITNHVVYITPAAERTQFDAALKTIRGPNRRKIAQCIGINYNNMSAITREVGQHRPGRERFLLLADVCDDQIGVLSKLRDHLLNTAEVVKPVGLRGGRISAKLKELMGDS